MEFQELSIANPRRESDAGWKRLIAVERAISFYWVSNPGAKRSEDLWTSSVIKMSEASFIHTELTSVLTCDQQITASYVHTFYPFMSTSDVVSPSP
ncbi:uncharacterized [Tachysurus ichikawai]